MREHPIPQDITNYRFHIVGSMTLKQFGEVFLGVIIAIIIYSTNLIDPVKWVLMLMSVGLGGAAAFVPIEERPLDHWIITFFRTLYKPTKFFWTRHAVIPDPFLYEPRENQEVYEPEVDLSPAKKARIKEYLVSVNTPSENQSDLTNWEAEKIRNIVGIFSDVDVSVPATAPQVQKKVDAKPNLGVRVRSLRGSSLNVVKSNSEVTIYDTSSEIEPSPIQAVDLAEVENMRELSFPERSTLPKQAVSEDVRAGMSSVEIPETTAPSVDESPEEEVSEENNQAAFVDAQNPMSFTTTKKEEKYTNTDSVEFNEDLPFPDPPTEPNKIVGMVLNQNNDLITNAIVEIQTKDGQIVRAVKTNALGQFFVTTPLNNGDYIVVVEKDGLSFSPQAITLRGEIVSPLEIRST